MAETGKNERVLDIYTRLLKGETINKFELASQYGVNEKSVQRDIEDIRNFFSQKLVEDGQRKAVVYDRRTKGYYLETMNQENFTNSEILAICKILLESRALMKEDMDRILRKLLSCCVSRKNFQVVKELIANESFHYVEPRHRRNVLDKLWDIGTAVKECRIIKITYNKRNGESVSRRLKPLAIMFSEYYFYLTAYVEDAEKIHFQVKNDPSPTIYRIDRIASMEITEEHFKIPYKDRFEEGEFRKRVQFMYGGELQKTMFWYKGEAVEAVLDRLPTAEILKEEGGRYLISAETFGTGIEMWLRSQGENVEKV